MKNRRKQKKRLKKKNPMAKLLKEPMLRNKIINSLQEQLEEKDQEHIKHINILERQKDMYKDMAKENSRLKGHYYVFGGIPQDEKGREFAKSSLKTKRNYIPALFELGISEMGLCNKVAARDALTKCKRDRQYRKAASDYLKQENFDFYTSHCN